MKAVDSDGMSATSIARTWAVLSAAARRVVTAADADLPVAEITTVNALMDTRLTERRFTMTVLAAFAASALGLAIIGVYGIVAYGVAQRTREIGLRAALGAQRTTLVGLFVREGIVNRAWGLPLYYGAQVLLAWSCASVPASG